MYQCGWPAWQVTAAAPPYACTALTLPATTRTPLGFARQIANADNTEHPIATQNAIV